jgi:tRNA pseudouridine38-40 synthase
MDAGKVCLVLEYDGSAFHGWQRQPGLRTVQAELERALATVLRRPVAAVGQGRTDAGVHAEGQTAHVLIPDGTEPGELRRRLNGLLGPDCAVLAIRPVPAGFHARYSALERIYRYGIVLRPSPLLERTHWRVEGEFDRARIERILPAFLGEHDFGWFCSHSRPMAHTRCSVRVFTLAAEGAVLTFRIAANRFLHNMVRRLVGDMAEVARGRWSEADVIGQLDRPGPATRGRTAPAHGLVLERVVYRGMDM